jgi:hypothetical protein
MQPQTVNLLMPVARASPHVGAVWFGGAMGLLDDAIREHLELMRLRGADPGAVAREEQNALGPARGEDEAKSLESEHSGENVRQESGVLGTESMPTLNTSMAGQETIEINMEAELGGGVDIRQDQGATPQPKLTTPVEHRAQTQNAAEESLEWEVPSQHDKKTSTGAASESQPSEDAGEEREAVEHVEDVLEETPDFLRDTPEQERLWFEQRPPRDFDFNE